MANSVFGALRRWGKSHGVSYGTSASFRSVAFAAALLRPGGADADGRAARDFDERIFHLARGVSLQQYLEVVLSLPHRRSLRDAALEAVHAGLVDSDVLEIALRASAARHKRWVRRARWKPV